MLGYKYFADLLAAITLAQDGVRTPLSLTFSSVKRAQLTYNANANKRANIANVKVCGKLAKSKMALSLHNHGVGRRSSSSIFLHHLKSYLSIKLASYIVLEIRAQYQFQYQLGHVSPSQLHVVDRPTQLICIWISIC